MDPVGRATWRSCRRTRSRAIPSALWIRARGRRPLAYDHRAILRSAVARLEGKLWWSNIAVGILPGAFTMSEARRVYEAIAGVRYDGATFARDLKATGLVVATGDRRSAGGGGPAPCIASRSARRRGAPVTASA